MSVFFKLIWPNNQILFFFSKLLSKWKPVWNPWISGTDFVSRDPDQSKTLRWFHFFWCISYHSVNFQLFFGAIIIVKYFVNLRSNYFHFHRWSHNVLKSTSFIWRPKLRINVLWGNSDFPQSLLCCLKERAKKIIFHLEEVFGQD